MKETAAVSRMACVGWPSRPAPSAGGVVVGRVEDGLVEELGSHLLPPNARLVCGLSSFDGSDVGRPGLSTAGIRCTRSGTERASRDQAKE